MAKQKSVWAYRGGRAAYQLCPRAHSWPARSSADANRFCSLYLHPGGFLGVTSLSVISPALLPLTKLIRGNNCHERNDGHVVFAVMPARHPVTTVH